MSVHRVREKVVLPNAVRDFRLSFRAETADMVLDLWQQYGVVGLDWWIINSGANALDVSIDGQPAVSVAVGAQHDETNIKFSNIFVDVGAGAEEYALVVAGILCL